MSTKKKIIIALIVTVVVVGGIYGILQIIKKNSADSKIVNVYAVSEIGSDSYYMGMDSLGGTVAINMEQKIYPISTQQIKEIYVAEGDHVKTGDVILEYDTTAQSLRLETERTEVELARTDILVAERELEELKKVVPVEDRIAANTEASSTEAAVTETPSTEADTDTASETSEESQEAPLSTDTDAEPSETATSDDNEAADAVNSDSDSDNASADSDIDAQQNQASNQNVNPILPDDGEILYTRDELAKAISDKQAQIKSLNIAYQLKEIEYEIMQYQVTNGQVVANFDGVVKTIKDEEEALTNNEAMIVISGNSGYTVQSSIGELSLGKIKLGDSVDLYCYDTGMMYTGTVSDISVIPTTDSYSYSSILQTNYPMSITIDDADDLEQGMYMEITTNNYDEEMDAQTGSSYYLPMAFVKRENDNYYVMKDVGGKLKKSYVEGGKIIWGDTLEIKKGIGYGDYIAFPYASDAVEGVKTKHATADELYY